MTKKLQRPGGRSTRVRHAVLSAFVDVLVESGYSQVSLEALADRAGVHKTTLYRRWGSRENLLLDAALYTAAEAVPLPDTGSLRSDLRDLSAAVAENLRSPAAEAMLRAVVSEAMTEPRVAEVVRQFWQTRFVGAREIVARAIERGEAPPSTDPDLIIESLIGPMYLRVLVTQEPLDHQFLTALLDFVLRGATASPRPASPDATKSRS